MAKRQPGPGQNPLFGTPSTTTQTNTAGGTARRSKGTGGGDPTHVIPDPAAIFRVHIAGSDSDSLSGAWDQTAGPGAVGFDPVIKKADALVTAADDMIRQMQTVIQMQRTFLADARSLMATQTNAQVGTFQQVQVLAQQVVKDMQNASVVAGGPGPGGGGPGTRAGLHGAPTAAQAGPFGRGGHSLGSLREQINLQLANMQPGSMRSLGSYAALRGAIRYDERIAEQVQGYNIQTDPRTGEPIGVTRTADHPAGLGPVTPEEENSVLRTAHRGYVAGRMTQGFLQGGTRGAFRAIPRAGVAFMGGEALIGAGNWVAEQRAANAEFQAIYGGQNIDWNPFNGGEFTTSGAAQRVRGQLWRAGQWGVMTGEHADTLFRGVSAMGLQGDDRQRALQFASEQYRERGMDAETSLAVMETAARNGNVALVNVASALDTVSAAARRSGLNVNEATKAFVQQYEAVASAIPVSGGGAPVVAAAQTAHVLAGGRAVSSLNVTGMNAPTQQYMLASRAGMTVGQVAALGATNPVAYLRLQEAQESGAWDLGVNKNIAAQFMPEIEKMVAANEGTEFEGRLSPSQMSRINTMLLNSGAISDPNTTAQVLAELTGKVIDPSQAGAEWANFVTNSPAEEAEKVLRESAITPAETPAGMIGPNEQARERAGGRENNMLDFFSFGRAENRKRNDDLRDYENYVNRTGQYNPMIEQLLQTTNYDSDRRFRVRVAGGERVVDTDDLIKHFADQAATGEVEIVEGEGKGGTLGEQDWARVDPTLAKTGAENTKSAQDKELTGIGEEYGEYKKDSDKDKGKGGSITLDASDELKRWLRINTTGNVEWQNAAASGYPTRPGAGVP